MNIGIRPRMLFAHMRAAQAYADTSYARRLQVGCVIVDPRTDQPLSIGWNGTAPGAPNVCEQEVDGQLVSVGVIHAEENALNKIPEYAKNWQGLVMFVTHSPCPECTKRIISSGQIQKVIYKNQYRITDGIVEMINAGIHVYQMIGDQFVLYHKINHFGNLISVQVASNPDK